MFPIRCFSCGKVVAKHEREYFHRIDEGEDPQSIFDSLKISRGCCKRMFLTHPREIIDILLLYPD